jgi:hypothetical protein
MFDAVDGGMKAFIDTTRAADMGLRTAFDHFFESTNLSQDYKLLKEIVDYFENDTSFSDCKEVCKKLAVTCYFESHNEGAGINPSKPNDKFIQRLKDRFGELKESDDKFKNFLGRLEKGNENSFLTDGGILNENVVSRKFGKDKLIKDDEFKEFFRKQHNDFEQNQSGHANTLIASFPKSSPPKPALPTPGVATASPTPGVAIASPPPVVATTSATTASSTPEAKLSGNFASKPFKDKYDELKSITNNFQEKDYAQNDIFKQFCRYLNYKIKSENKDKSLQPSNTVTSQIENQSFYISSQISYTEDSSKNDLEKSVFLGTNTALAVVRYAESLDQASKSFKDDLDKFAKFACTKARHYSSKAIVEVYESNKDTIDTYDYNDDKSTEIKKLFEDYNLRNDGESKDKKVVRVLKILNKFLGQDYKENNKKKSLDFFIKNYGAFGEINQLKSLDILNFDKKEPKDENKKKFLISSAIYSEMANISLPDEEKQPESKILNHIKDKFFAKNPLGYKKFLQENAYDFLEDLQKKTNSPFKGGIEEYLFVDDLTEEQKKFIERQALENDYIKDVVLTDSFLKKKITRQIASIDNKEIGTPEYYKSFDKKIDGNENLFKTDDQYPDFVKQKPGLRSYLTPDDKVSEKDTCKFKDNKIGCEIDPSQSRYSGVDIKNKRIVNLYCFERTLRDGTKKERKIFLNDPACLQVKNFLEEFDNKISELPEGICKNFTPEGLARCAIDCCKKRGKEVTIKNISQELDLFLNYISSNSVSKLDPYYQSLIKTSENIDTNLTNAEQILNCLIDNGMQISGSASIIRRYNVKKEKKGYCGCLRGVPEVPEKSEPYITTESCDFQGTINVGMEDGKKYSLEIDKDGTAKISENQGKAGCCGKSKAIHATYHKSTTLSGDKPKVMQTRFREKIRMTIFPGIGSGLKKISKETESIESVGHGYYFEKHGSDDYRLMFLEASDKVPAEIRTYSHAEFSDVCKPIKGDSFPTPFRGLLNGNRFNLPTQIAYDRHIKKYLPNRDKTKNLNIPVYENGTKIDEILNVKLSSISFYKWPSFGMRHKSGGASSQGDNQKGGGR